MHFLLSPLALIAILLTMAGSSFGANSKTIADINITASLLAGRNSPDASTRITDNRAWQQHREAMQKAWSKYRTLTLDPMLSWSSGENGPNLPPGGVVRYTFSGPDVLHVMRMFPRADSYVLCGLEPIGKAPRSKALEGKSAGSALAEIRTILEESIRYSFFRTSDMQKELPAATYAGTLPIMCLFLAADGHRIRNIDFLSLDSDGRLTSLGDNPGKANAVRIDVRCNDGKARSIRYFQTNIANGALRRSGFLTYLESLPPGPSYVKASSYLMHESYFSQIKDHLLSSSTSIIQDDSGIPLRFFDRSKWKITPYGKYETPTDLFKRYHQEDLRKAFRSGAQSLPFGTGYRWRKGQSNLVLATRGGRKSPARRAITAIGRILPGKAKRTSSPKPATPPQPAPLAEKKGKTAHSRTPLVATLELITSSSISKQQAVNLHNAFIINEYKVVAVHNGEDQYLGKRIRVARTCLFHGRRLPGQATGSTISLKLVPIANYPDLLRWHIEDDLPEKKAVIIHIASQNKTP